MKGAEYLSPLTLAFLGDAVYEVYVRRQLIVDGKINPRRLHREKMRFVTAKSQSIQLDAIRGLLTEAEEGIIRRAKNAKPAHMPRNTPIMDYMKATAFEALIGFLYLTGETGRMEEMIFRGMRTVMEEESPK